MVSMGVYILNNDLHSYASTIYLDSITQISIKYSVKCMVKPQNTSCCARYSTVKSCELVLSCMTATSWSMAYYSAMYDQSPQKPLPSNILILLVAFLLAWGYNLSRITVQN